MTPSTSRATSGAEQPLDLLGRRDGILDRVVEDRGGDRLVVEMEVGQDARDLDRVAEIGVADGALLGAVRLDREDIGAVEQRLVGIGIVARGPDRQVRIGAARVLRWGAALLCNATSYCRYFAATLVALTLALHLASASASKRLAVGREAGERADALDDQLAERSASRSGACAATQTRRRAHFHSVSRVMKLVLAGAATGVAA